jgi:hypothetical protein
MRNETLRLIPIASSKYTNQAFMKETGVDLAKSKGEIFTGKYTKKENENDLFFFIQNGNLLAILKGIKEIKTPLYTFYSYSAGEKPNWKKLKMEENLTIVRIPEKELTYKPTKKVKEREIKIKDRLDKYKREKYNWLTMEGLEHKMKRCVKGAMEFALTTNPNKEIEKEFKKLIWFYSNPSDVLKVMTDSAKQITDYKKLEENGDEFGRKYSENRMKDIKVTIIKIENILDKYGYIEDVFMEME